MDFVVLRSKEGERLVNADHIIRFEGGPLGTIVVVLSDGVTFAVTEIPDEIRASIKNIPTPPAPEPVEPTPKIKRPLSES